MRYSANREAESWVSMNKAMSSGAEAGGQANGNVCAATAASSMASPRSAAVTRMAMPAKRPLEIPLRQVVAGLRVDQHDIGHQVAVAVPPDAAGHGRPLRCVQQRVLQRIGGIGIAGDV